MIAKTQPLFIIERKKKGAEQARIIPNTVGRFEIRTEQAKPLYLPEAESLCLKMAELAGIETADNTLIENAGEEMVLMVNQPKNQQSIGDLSKIKPSGYDGGSYEQLVKAIEKASVQPGLDKINMAERLLFAYLAGCSTMNWGTIVYMADGKACTVIQCCAHYPIAACISQSMLMLALGGKRSNITEQSFDIFFEKININTVAANNTKRRFTRLLRSWFELVEESFLPERLKRNYVHIVIDRAERLDMM